MIGLLAYLYVKLMYTIFYWMLYCTILFNLFLNDLPLEGYQLRTIPILLAILSAYLTENPPSMRR